MRRTAMGLILLVTLSSTMLPAQARAEGESHICRVDTLHPSIQDELARHYGGWRVQQPNDLSPRARERWQAEKGVECPGIVSGFFDGTKETSYALLLVPADRNATGLKLLVFKCRTGGPCSMMTVDRGNDEKSANFFIHKAQARSFFDAASMKNFQVEAQEVILLFDAGENEYEVDAYFWTHGSYKHQPVDY